MHLSNSRPWLALALFLACFAAVPAIAGKPDPATGLDLRATLEKGLKARRPQEFRFIARVSQLVDQGLLPEKLVKATFNWARDRNDRPFQAFEFALREQAANRGIRL